MEFENNTQQSVLFLTKTNIQSRFGPMKRCIFIKIMHNYNWHVIFFRFEKHTTLVLFQRETKVKLNTSAKTQSDHEYFYKHNNRKIISHSLQKKPGLAFSETAGYWPWHCFYLKENREDQKKNFKIPFSIKLSHTWLI